MLTRAEHVAICQTCQKSVFNAKKGIVCSLTGEHANYDTLTCPDFLKDEVAFKRQIAAKERAEREQIESESFGFASKKGKNQVFGGIALILAGIVWIVTGLLFGRIFFYPIALIVFGVINIVKGGNNMKNQKKKEQNDILDDDLL